MDREKPHADCLAKNRNEIAPGKSRGNLRADYRTGAGECPAAWLVGRLNNYELKNKTIMKIILISAHARPIVQTAHGMREAKRIAKRAREEQLLPQIYTEKDYRYHLERRHEFPR